MVDASWFGELLRLCQRSFPDRLDQMISQIQDLPAERHPMLTLSLSWRRGGQPCVERLILRRYADNWTWWSFDDRDKARREWAVQRWLYGLGLPVPRLYAGGSESAGGSLLMARVGGRRCCGPQGTGAARPGTLAVPVVYVDALADLLVRLHRLTPPDSVRQVLPNVMVNEELVRLSELARQCGDDGLGEAVEELKAIEMEMLSSCVLHGDPHPGNVLCDARGITALLDWENSAFGDPRWDVARVANWLHRSQQDELAERFCSMYAAGMGTRTPDLLFWQVLAAAQEWAVLLRVSQRATPGPRPTQVADRSEYAWRALTHLRFTRREQ